MGRIDQIGQDDQIDLTAEETREGDRGAPVETHVTLEEVQGIGTQVGNRIDLPGVPGTAGPLSNV